MTPSEILVKELASVMVKQLARARAQESIKKYTEVALKKSTLSSVEKIKLVALNQENRLSIIMRVQKHTLDNVFIKIPDKFFTKNYHYDWWAFPMHVPEAWGWEQRNYDASVTLTEAQTLLYDAGFVATYKSCISMYLDALKKHGWNDYPVRFARMLQSISLFIKGASEIKDMEDEYANLCTLGTCAVEYAKAHVMNEYPTYGLLQSGFEETIKELGKFKTPEVSHPLALV